MMEPEVVRVKPPAVPANNGTATLLDTTADPGTGTTLTQRGRWPKLQRARITVFVNQAMTYYVDWIDEQAANVTWRVTNGGGAGETVTASTLFERDALIFGHDARIRLLAGATAPTTWEVSIKLIFGDQALGQ